MLLILITSHHPIGYGNVTGICVQGKIEGQASKVNYECPTDRRKQSWQQVQYILTVLRTN
ncbi:hypothetical protein [Paludibacterium yongneupense]|uniref:hypothetical protein n=1 Tax=Paludibacterium yongneupense TaxID=400061 RepID=UPI0012ECB8E5|nr:hypothetical protein [Paludibacterium yongneupense]